jgi:hypothetical protein
LLLLIAAGYHAGFILNMVALGVTLIAPHPLSWDNFVVGNFLSCSWAPGVVCNESIVFIIHSDLEIIAARVFKEVAPVTRLRW